ncbi:hypothetical protein [Bacillus sp. SJS]|uniref:hypothetical protein n=1 Tax=Bacillus sp. SJS TaxID=1423321 RepID=UPI000AF03607|nr:hypothetical protein [Bacillus sp. SJS]
MPGKDGKACDARQECQAKVEKGCDARQECQAKVEKGCNAKQTTAAPASLTHKKNGPQNILQTAFLLYYIVISISTPK